MRPSAAVTDEHPMSTPDRNRDRDSDRQAEDEDARISELVNERVAARLAEIDRQQDEQQRRTDHVRSGNDHETRHQQDAGRPSVEYQVAQRLLG